MNSGSGLRLRAKSFIKNVDAGRAGLKKGDVVHSINGFSRHGVVVATSSKFLKKDEGEAVENIIDSFL